ncbi:MAG TPA: cytochrome c biogenesis protein ResB [Elusimicrobiota bacterium]|nr:cytochrome c biogenesis protein ResB [Elusimicrobiota bacterium]
MRPNDVPLKRVTDLLSSMKLTLVCLALLMVLVVACTLLQVPLGTHLAVERTIRSFLVWYTPDWSPVRLPVFPGGGLVGGVLLVNLLFAQFLKLERSRRKAGLWLAHAGLALLFLGEFSTAMLQVESQMPVEVGQTKNYSEDTRQMELAVVDATDPAKDTVTTIPESRLRPGAEIVTPSLPFKIDVKRWYDNSDLGMRKPTDPPSEATAGVGASLSVSEAPIVTSDDAQNAAAALIEPVAGGDGLGTYWVSNALGAPQGFVREGRAWRLVLRPRRYYLPFSVTLKEFKHDIYPGTDIPKNFSSLVRLDDPGAGEDRDALIYMNHPLRYGGKTFYQASFGQNDQLSVFQVVRNPGWLIPYLSCILVALGLLLHFGVKLSASLKRAR